MQSWSTPLVRHRPPTRGSTRCWWAGRGGTGGAAGRPMTATPIPTTSWSASPWRRGRRGRGVPRRRRGAARLGRHAACGTVRRPPARGRVDGGPARRDHRLARPRVGQHADQGGSRMEVHPRDDARGGELPVAAGGAHPADRRRGQGEPRLPAAGRGGRHDQPVELPAAPEQPVHRPRAGVGQRGRHQAGLGHPGDRRPPARQDLRGGGPPPRRAQRGHRRGRARSANGSCSIRCLA